MDYGAILKKAWHITWRYKALWILGMFAGVTGAGGGGGGSSRGSWDSGSGSGSGSAMPDFSEFSRNLLEYLPAIIAAGVLLVLIGLVWWVFAVAARGGLIAGVNSIEEGSPKRLGELWSVGFSRFWRMFGLDILLVLPLMVVSLLILGAIFIPLISAGIAGREPRTEMLAPMCGGLAIGIPILIVGGFILGVMRIIGQRYIILGGQGPIEAAKNGWRFLRARVGSTLLMYLINWGLAIGASIVLAIPMVALGLGLGVPLFMSAYSEKWGAFLGLLAVTFVLVTILGLAFSAIWGTFTSAIWTLFFRQVAGMGAPTQSAPVVGYQPQQSAQPGQWDSLVQPTPPEPSAPPAWAEQSTPPPPPPPAAPVGPPIAGAQQEQELPPPPAPPVPPTDG